MRRIVHPIAASRQRAACPAKPGIRPVSLLLISIRVLGVSVWFGGSFHPIAASRQRAACPAKPGIRPVSLLLISIRVLGVSVWFGGSFHPVAAGRQRVACPAKPDIRPISLLLTSLRVLGVSVWSGGLTNSGATDCQWVACPAKPRCDNRPDSPFLYGLDRPSSGWVDALNPLMADPNGSGIQSAPTVVQVSQPAHAAKARAIGCPAPESPARAPPPWSCTETRRSQCHEAASNARVL